MPPALPPLERTPLDRLAVPLLLAFGLALHLCWIAAPFGFHEINAGYFFGPFAQHWERFGWFELRGTPLGASAVALPETPQQGHPYWNHPPGFAWLCSLAGTAEWQLRLPCVFAAIGSGPLLFLLARPRLPAAAALLAGLLVQCCPAIAFSAVVSYESVVIACGLLLLLLHERARQSRRAALGAAAVAALGLWMDWAFGFYLLALGLWSLPARGRVWLVRLARPAAAAAASLLGIVAWRAWAGGAPLLPPPQPGHESAVAMLVRALLVAPPWGLWLELVGDRLRDGFGPALLLAAAAGALPAVLRAPRLVGTLLLPALLNLLVFRNHAAGHVMFFAYAGPPFALAAAHLFALAARWRSAAAVAAALGLALVGATTWYTAEWKRGAVSPMFRTLGATLSRLAEEPSPDGDVRPSLVATNATQNYPYYVRSPRVLLSPVVARAAIAAQRGGPSRLRYVYVDTEMRVPGQPVQRAGDVELRAWLGGFPSRALPELVGAWQLGHGIELVVHGAHVYDL